MKLKFLATLALLSGLITFSYAQKGADSEWSLYKEHPKLRIESKLVSCEAHDIKSDVYLLKFTNKSSSPIKVTYFREYYYEGEGCATCPNDEYKTTLTIPAGATLIGTCDASSPDNQHLTMFKEYTSHPTYNGGRKYEKFEIRLISVE